MMMMTDEQNQRQSDMMMMNMNLAEGKDDEREDSSDKEFII
jgi:hypothetical protein